MSKKKHKRSNPRPVPKAKPSSNPSNINPVLVGLAAIAVVAAVILLAVVTTQKPTATPSSTATPSPSPSPSAAVETELYTPPALDEDTTYYADIDIQDYGTITVELDQSAAPVTCANFVELAQAGFYDGLTFHRIMEGFMMQGGDPLGNGTGGSEHEIVGEFSENGHENPLSHTRGTISMARSNDPDSASSQFFIVHEDSTFLDGKYAAFGTVTAGMDVVDAVCEDAQPTDSNGTIPAQEQPIITSVTIRTA